MLVREAEPMENGRHAALSAYITRPFGFLGGFIRMLLPLAAANSRSVTTEVSEEAEREHPYIEH